MKYAILIKIDDEKFDAFRKDIKEYLATMDAKLVYERHSKFNRIRLTEDGGDGDEEQRGE